MFYLMHSKSLRVGSVVLKNRLFLSPMVDVTDCAYRLLCRKYGASIAYTEMIYIDAILHENNKTKNLMIIGGDFDRPIGLQVTGNKVSEFVKLSKLSVLRDYDLIKEKLAIIRAEIIAKAKETLRQGLDLLGIKVLEEM